jgi:hypothetical protein
MGILFAKISHPKGRGRTILISDCAVVARRDGALKLWAAAALSGCLPGCGPVWLAGRLLWCRLQAGLL